MFAKEAGQIHPFIEVYGRLGEVVVIAPAESYRRLRASALGLDPRGSSQGGAGRALRGLTSTRLTVVCGFSEPICATTHDHPETERCRSLRRQSASIRGGMFGNLTNEVERSIHTISGSYTG